MKFQIPFKSIFFGKKIRSSGKKQEVVVDDVKTEKTLSSLDVDDSSCWVKNDMQYMYLEKVKLELEEKGFSWIPGHHYRSLLFWFGATLEDLNMIESGAIHEQVQQDREATMSFRHIAFHRVLLNEEEEEPNCGFDERDSSTLSSDTKTTATTRESKNNDGMKKRRSSNISLANCESVTQIMKEEICSQEGAKVYFERSGTRKWNLPPPTYGNSSVPYAIAKINDFLQPKDHHYQSNLNMKSKTTINDQLLIRINKDDNNDLAEPTPEGIHQDGTEISSVTVIQRKNVSEIVGSESRIWKLEQPTGNYDSPCFGVLKEDNPTIPKPNGFSWDNCLFDKALDDAWETIIFNDRMVKHEARAFIRKEASKGQPCYRDVIVNFLRKPCSDGSDTMMVDNKEVTLF